MSYNNSNQYYQPSSGGRRNQQHAQHQIPQQYTNVYYSNSGVPVSNGAHFHEPLHLNDYLVAPQAAAAANNNNNNNNNNNILASPNAAAGMEQWPELPPAAEEHLLQPHAAHGQYYGHGVVNVNVAYDPATIINNNTSTDFLTNMYSYYNHATATNNVSCSSPPNRNNTNTNNSNHVYNYMPSDFDPIAVPSKKFSPVDAATVNNRMDQHQHNNSNNNNNIAYYPNGSNNNSDDSSSQQQIFANSEPTIHISGISDKPMASTDVLTMVAARGTDVITKYLPCVEFLVICQQELRRAVEKNQKAPAKQRFSNKQFFNTYLHPLTDRFYRKNVGVMLNDHLQSATNEIHNLLVETKKVEYLGCDHMKVTFLGGMREGQSWGLRHWLSKHGAALQACNELEMVLTAMQKLDPSSTFTVKLAARLRKETSFARTRLLKDVPKAYQQFSSAHPFLPFFHRLESALKGLAEFDPEDDDVIILDDAEQEKMKVAAASAQKMRETNNINNNKSVGRQQQQQSKKRALSEHLDDSHTATSTTASRKRATGSTRNTSTSSIQQSNFYSLIDADAHLNNMNNNNTENNSNTIIYLSSNNEELKRNSMSPTPFVTTAAAAAAGACRHSEGDILDDSVYDEFSSLFEGETNQRLFDSSDQLVEHNLPFSQGDWRCVECTYMNTSCVDFCLMCERTRTTNSSNTSFVSNTENNATIDNTLLLF